MKSLIKVFFIKYLIFLLDRSYNSLYNWTTLIYLFYINETPFMSLFMLVNNIYLPWLPFVFNNITAFQILTFELFAPLLYFTSITSPSLKWMLEIWIEDNSFSFALWSRKIIRGKLKFKISIYYGIYKFSTYLKVKQHLS